MLRHGEETAEKRAENSPSGLYEKIRNNDGDLILEISIIRLICD